MKSTKFNLGGLVAATMLMQAADSVTSTASGIEVAEAKSTKTKTVYNTVKMDDGTVVEFPGKRRVLKSPFIEDGVVKVRFDFVNGEVRVFTMPEALMLRFAAHGASQKLGDSFAGVADLDDAIQTYDENADRLAKGQWSEESSGGGNTGSSVLQKALMEVTGKSAEDIRTFLANKSQKEKLALRSSPKIKPTVDRLEAEKLARSAGKTKDAVDTTDMLGELGIDA